jgi:hypothetical protein
VPGGSITVLCVGDSIYQAAVTISDAKYRIGPNPLTTNPKVDVTFIDGTVSTEYVYTCAAGQLVGGAVTPEHTG